MDVFDEIIKIVKEFFNQVSIEFIFVVHHLKNLNLLKSSILKLDTAPNIINPFVKLYLLHIQKVVLVVPESFFHTFHDP